MAMRRKTNSRTLGGLGISSSLSGLSIPTEVILLRQHLDVVAQKKNLYLQRLLTPERAVVTKRGDALRQR
jgi:hypothetical protein